VLRAPLCLQALEAFLLHKVYRGDLRDVTYRCLGQREKLVILFRGVRKHHGAPVVATRSRPLS
jgi:hypothetical protein